MKNPAEIAVARFGQKYNCAQSVFSAFAAPLGLDEETALKIASPFGGGVARQGEVCGAATGGLMALGLARGSSSPDEKEKDEVYRLSLEFLRRFEEKHGKILCRDLIGYDLRDHAAHEQARQAGVFTSICPRLVRDAAGIVALLLEK
ncbi:MAG: CGCAxxGCC family protein [Anaerolineaceae bacterium]|nr:MAG: CGCAxxGCC family protein [Anaerolineaceae bacterium]